VGAEIEDKKMIWGRWGMGTNILKEIGAQEETVRGVQGQGA